MISARDSDELEPHQPPLKRAIPRTNFQSTSKLSRPCCYCNKHSDSPYDLPLRTCASCRRKVAHQQCIPGRRNREKTSLATSEEWICFKCERKDEQLNDSTDFHDPSTSVNHAVQKPVAKTPEQPQMEEQIDFGVVEFPETPPSAQAKNSYNSWAPSWSRLQVVEPVSSIAFENEDSWDDDDIEVPAKEVTPKPWLNKPQFGRRVTLSNRLSAAHHDNIAMEKRQKRRLEAKTGMKLHERVDASAKLWEKNRALKDRLMQAEETRLSMQVETRQAKQATAAATQQIEIQKDLNNELQKQLEQAEAKLINALALEETNKRLTIQLGALQREGILLRSDKVKLQQKVSGQESEIRALQEKLKQEERFTTTSSNKINTSERHAHVSEGEAIRATQKSPQTPVQTSSPYPDRQSDRASSLLDARMLSHANHAFTTDSYSHSACPSTPSTDPVNKNRKTGRSHASYPKKCAPSVSAADSILEGEALVLNEIGSRKRRKINYSPKGISSHTVISLNEDETSDDGHQARIVPSPTSQSKHSIARVSKPEWDSSYEIVDLTNDRRPVPLPDQRNLKQSVNRKHEGVSNDLVDLNLGSNIPHQDLIIDSESEGNRPTVMVVVNPISAVRSIESSPPNKRKALNDFNDAFGISYQAKPVLLGSKKGLAFSNTESSDRRRSGRGAARKAVHSTFRIGRDIGNTLTG